MPTRAVNRRSSAILIGAIAVLALCAGEAWLWLRREPLVLRDVGPRLLSNQTSQPIALSGTGFRGGMTLRLGAPFQRTLPVTTVNKHHAYARLPADLAMADGRMQASAVLSLDGARTKGQPLLLTVVNDRGFPDLTVLAASPDGRHLYAASTPTDALFRIEPDTGAVTALPGGDGPSALAAWTSADGHAWLAIAHAWEPALWICDAQTGAAVRKVPAPAYATGLLVDSARGLALVAEHATDTVVALSLADGAVRFRARVDPNPGPMALVGDTLVVGSQQTGTIQAVSLSDGRVGKGIAPIPGTAILGGHTEPFSASIMGGKAPRALAWSQKARRLLVSSVGPNIGPNAERMEVSMNGGVGVVDVGGGRFERHLGFGFGVPEGLALDDAGSLLYVADIGSGLVRTVDVAKLVSPDPAVARTAALGAVPISPPDGFPTARPASDFGVHGRAGVELHSGPRALVLSPDAATLYVLDRFTGTLAVLDVREARRGRTGVVRQIPLVDTLAQRERRIGQILYFTDVGKSAMSCDTCHLEGHGEGVLFEKTQPLRIYRSPTVRGVDETPPYFVPASTFNLAQTNRTVADRNRYFNPRLTEAEVHALTVYTTAIATLPNPFVEESGAPPSSLVLPDGQTGRPRIGMTLFEGKAKCSGCHPAPYFTQDQDPATRNRFIEVGTPHLLPLRPEQQSPLFRGFGIPALIGAWDVWPMLTTGAAGFGVDALKGTLEVTNRFALRAVIESYSHPPHGRASSLSPREKNDLLAYLLSL